MVVLMYTRFVELSSEFTWLCFNKMLTNGDFNIWMCLRNSHLVCSDSLLLQSTSSARKRHETLAFRDVQVLNEDGKICLSR